MTLTARLSQLVTGLSRTATTSSAIPDALRERALTCLPERLKAILASRHRRLLIEPDGSGSAVMSLVSGAVPERLGVLSLDGVTALPAAVYGHDRERAHSVELVLLRDAVLLRSVTFPAQVRSNLPQVIRYELDRLSPFEASQVLFDFSIQPGSKRSDRLVIDLAICRRDALQGWIERLRDAGSPIHRIHWQGAWPRANLLPPEERPRGRGLRPTWGMLLGVLILALAIGALATPLWQKGRIAASLDEALRQARGQALAVDALRQELERARQGSLAVLQRKLDQPPILDLLRDLTDRLPDSTWVQNLDYNEGQVDIRGESEHATALIALLEQTPGIDEVSFKSPVTQIARTGKERFNISLRFNPETAP